MNIETTILKNNTWGGIVKHARKGLFAVSTMALLAGCAGTVTDQPSGNAGTLTDANIAAIVVGANKIDISAGELAIERSNNPEVKAFAQRMITDHNAVLSSAVKLVTRLGVTPVNNDLVATLSKQSAEHEAKLRTLSGKAFDKAYIDHEVAYHEAVNSVIEDQLIPGAKNQELKDTLISVVPAFKAHLKHCQMIQRTI
jgi:putative membrane protein